MSGPCPVTGQTGLSTAVASHFDVHPALLMARNGARVCEARKGSVGRWKCLGCKIERYWLALYLSHVARVRALKGGIA